MPGEAAAARTAMTGDAVVIGAGLAGLAAARVLADRFARVTVLDRDQLPPEPESRRGVPQGGHPHVLLAVGRAVLENLFPGLTEELVDRGATWIDVARDAIFWQLDGYRLRVDSGIRMLCMSRPLLESCLRQRLQALPQIVIRSETAVAGLIAGPGERVCGVELAGGDRLGGDLVVDASGRGSRSDRWLRQLGFPTPPESVVTMRVHYTSRLVRGRPEGLQGPGIIITTPTPPDHRRFGVVVPVEGNRWLVMLGGFHGEQAPTDPEGYQRYADGLPNTRIADLLHHAEPLTDPVAYTYPASRRRHFERLRRTPEGYLTIGDAMCSFNPVYAQGMTVAVLEAITLGECLDRYRSTGAPMTRAFYHRTGKLVTSAWNMATTADFAYTGTEGRKPPGFALAQWYQRQLLLATHVSPEVVNTLVRVEHLITPGSALLGPTMVVRVLRAARHARLTNPHVLAVPATPRRPALQRTVAPGAAVNNERGDVAGQSFTNATVNPFSDCQRSSLWCTREAAADTVTVDGCSDDDPGDQGRPPGAAHVAEKGADPRDQQQADDPEDQGSSYEHSALI